MKGKKKAVAAIALAAAMSCTALAGCDSLISQDVDKDYRQVVAEVDLRRSADFEEGGLFAGKNYENVISTSEITKRDMVSMFASQGGSLVGSGYSYGAIFSSISEYLVNRQVYVQYAKLYFIEEDEHYTVSGYTAATAAAEEAAAEAGASEEKEKLLVEIAQLGYFLDEEEKGKATYGVLTSLNASLDSEEESIIAAEEEESSADEDVRTLPTGVNASDDEYYDPLYKVYTATGKDTEYSSPAAASCGTYEAQDGSTPTYRKKAYNNFLTNLRTYSLLARGEDTSNVENLVYFSMELKNAYESALLTKLNDAFEAEGEAIFNENETDAWVQAQFDKKKTGDYNEYKNDTSGFATALDSMSDSSFLLAAPLAHYGFVINILLPFSTAQSQKLTDSSQDYGDKKGNKFAQRAVILKSVKATDQRGTWFTGEEDYSFEDTESKGYTGSLGNQDARKYLFFEDCLAGEDGKTGTEYEPLKNYFGEYTYNGTVTPPAEGAEDGKYSLTPKKIDIDEFLQEVEGYLGHAGLTATTNKTADYYSAGRTYYKTDGTVDYEKFVYAKGSISQLSDFDANNLFLRGTDENKAFSVINELSFAYNTDVGGLNSYLGYSVTPEKTSFVSEFEYAAQKVCEAGPGNYWVVPSDYGWHFIYCTFAFPAAETSPFSYDPAKSGEEFEGSFSNLFYENLKSQSVADFSSNRQTEIINTYAEACSTVYEERYADLSNLS